MFSTTIAIAAVSVGILSAASVSAIDSYFETVIKKKYIANLKIIIKKCLLSGFTYGLFLGVIFYAFNYNDLQPIRMIVIYSALLIFSTILSNSLVFGYSKLFAKKSDEEIAGDG